MSKLKVLWFDIDPSEFKRVLPNTKNFFLDLSFLCKEINKENLFIDFKEWKALCNRIKNDLQKV